MLGVSFFQTRCGTPLGLVHLSSSSYYALKVFQEKRVRGKNEVLEAIKSELELRSCPLALAEMARGK